MQEALHLLEPPPRHELVEEVRIIVVCIIFCSFVCFCSCVYLVLHQRAVDVAAAVYPKSCKEHASDINLLLMFSCR
jgi:hypothetical protein